MIAAQNHPSIMMVARKFNTVYRKDSRYVYSVDIPENNKDVISPLDISKAVSRIKSKEKLLEEVFPGRVASVTLHENKTSYTIK